MTRGQVRTRLQQLGHSPGLADRYFDLLDRGVEPPLGIAPASVARALGEIGISGAVGAFEPAPASEPDTVSRAEQSCAVAAPGELPIFGRELFCHSTTQFQPVTSGPVDPGYRVGPGDQLVLVLTGDVEISHTLEVTREGSLVIPDAGQIFVNGLTLRELEDRLYSRLGSVYSGIERGPGAATQFQVSLGRLRSNQIFLIGEVERPGAYQVSSAATVFNALYQARGPNSNGSFRKIEVRRAGRVIRTIDIYDYLLQGDSKDDVRIEQGDVIFVPVAGPQMSIRGAIRRSAIFELADGEDLRNLLEYAGGLQASAVVRRVQIDRILPPGQRQPGVDRVLIDVDVAELLDRGGDAVALRDGDIVQVFSVSAERRNRLTITGEVNRPGVYEWAPGTTLGEVVDRAEGLADPAYTPRAHIYRLNPEDGTRQLIRSPLITDTGGRQLPDVALADRDSIVIYSREELRNPEVVAIAGRVKNTGTYSLAAGMTLRDLVLAAGGFSPGADMLEADVARRPNVLTRTDTTALIIRVPLGAPDPAMDGDNGQSGYALSGGVPSWLPRSDEFVLQDGDQVFIRKAPGFDMLQSVSVTGEVLQPGTYVLSNRQDRLLDVLQRASGLTNEANPAGLRLIRDGSLVATDLTRALREPRGRFNLVLEAGDSIHLPTFDPTVLVTGAVAFESRMLYEPGQGMDYYVNRAGGFLEEADKGKVSVAYPDGERAAVKSYLLFRDVPSIQPGSTIFVPARPAGEVGFDWDRFLARTLSIVSTTVTLIIAADRL